jgi:hypothetical protein
LLYDSFVTLEIEADDIEKGAFADRFAAEYRGSGIFTSPLKPFPGFPITLPSPEGGRGACSGLRN